MHPPRQGAPPRAAKASHRDPSGPAYDLLHELDGAIEIRRYAPYAVAEVFVAGPADTAAPRALQILVGYLAGANLGERTIARTAPVTQSALDGGTLVRLALPQGVTPATAPVPTDSRVVRRELAGHTLAAIRYPGRWSPAHDRAQFERLTAVLRAARMTWAGEPRYARYNGPWSPWFLRRNEVWLRLS
ncbi:MAG TPA: heme-binding protein [Burkholderiaceae bacterium]|nr:heme-binding protein [Burkholderiaceae bacterium]